ncbi:restriction endonuclease subunit S [Enterobacteriaceae bacterium H11S18]|uniref:restriction endonuclease subunit S n=1 Tax=Dryocola clanedunensis TaxID=2925396 RepID=UPI0022F0E69D|nr:restriction endonuclease subunit S [Dryocola clanedunensis]MCT4708924.1 restriction endonuclease subunit S [Dryocola clanedunensis]
MVNKTLADACEIIMGQSPAGEMCNTSGVGLPLLNGPTEYGAHHPTPVQFTTDPRKRAKKGDLLFCVRGSTTGRMNWADRDYAIGRGVAAIRHKSHHKLQPLVRAVVEYNLPFLLIQATGSTFPNVSSGLLSNLPWPEHEENQLLAISHILGTLDDKIEINRKQNETLETMIRTLFKAWFLDFEPVRAKQEGRWQRGQSLPGLPAHLYDLFPERLVESESGEIPEGAEITSLSAYSSLNPESWTKRTRPEQIRYVDLSNTKWGRIESVTHYEADDAPSRAQRVLRPLDTIVGTVRPGNGSYALISDEGLTGSTGFAVLRPLEREYFAFVYLAATSRENIERLSNLADGGAYPAVRPDAVSSTQVMRAGHELINAFSRQVNPMLSGMADNDRTSQSLTQLRNTLLPKLISGDLHIPDAERILGASI